MYSIIRTNDKNNQKIQNQAKLGTAKSSKES